mmetsp:Transcript_30375/g.66537  ORF Transcript_30375/g.66537 Transcript_30375/m.66537 type:complete len:205 (+) Transcript_30375:2953-3567(+)
MHRLPLLRRGRNRTSRTCGSSMCMIRGERNHWRRAPGKTTSSPCASTKVRSRPSPLATAPDRSLSGIGRARNNRHRGGLQCVPLWPSTLAPPASCFRCAFSLRRSALSPKMMCGIRMSWFCSAPIWTATGYSWWWCLCGRATTTSSSLDPWEPATRRCLPARRLSCRPTSSRLRTLAESLPSVVAACCSSTSFAGAQKAICLWT